MAPGSLRSHRLRRATDPARQSFRQARCERRLVLEFAFEDDEGAPALRRIGGKRSLVPRPVAGDLGAPIGRVGLGRPRAARAIMSMPKAAMDENRKFAGGVDDVRLSRQIAAMKSVARAIGRRSARTASSGFVSRDLTARMTAERS